MRTAIVISALLVSLSLCAFGQAAREDNLRSADEVEIRQLIKQINQAYVSRNYEPFEHIYLDNFVAVRSKPQYNYRAQLIAMMKYDSRELSLGKPLDFQTITYDNDLPHLNFF